MSASYMMSQLQDTIKNAIQNRLWNDILPPTSFYFLSLPILLLLVGGLITMLLGVFKTEPDKPSYPAWYVALVVSFASAASAIFAKFPNPQAFLGSGVLIDDISRTSFIVIAIGTLFTLLACSMTALGKQLLRSELLTLFLFSSAGLMIMCLLANF